MALTVVPFDYELNRFIRLNNEQKSALMCGICLKIFQRPVITSCGHTFCDTCLQYWISQTINDWNPHFKCPECRRELNGHSNDIRDNRSLSALIDCLEINCLSLIMVVMLSLK